MRDGTAESAIGFRPEKAAGLVQLGPPCVTKRHTSMQFGDFSEQYTLYESAAAVILPLPYDRTSTWLKGADRGPGALLAASVHLEFYDIETGTEPFRRGICTQEPVVCPEDPAKMVDAVREAALPHFEAGKLVVGLGGEHSVSIGLVQAAAEYCDSLSVLQLDAHSDLRDEYEGSPYNHACVMARIREICPAVQVGIRSMDIEEVAAVIPERIVYAHDINRRGLAAADAALEMLSDNVYLTIDLDVLDPSIMPSTGTPEPGGLDWYRLTGLISRVAERRKIIGFDVVELLPRSHNPAPDFLAAKLVYRTLGGIFAARAPE